MHYKKYPAMQAEDIFKLLYQNEFGPGHMIKSAQDSLDMILKEASALTPQARGHEAREPIGNGLCRLYLSALRHGLSPEELNRVFVATANRVRGSAGGFEEKAAVFIKICQEGLLPFDPGEASGLLEAYRAAGYPPMRHSARYRQAYAPAYRVVDESLCDTLPFLLKKETT